MFLALFFSALTAQADSDVQCMARLGVSWVAVAPPTGAVVDDVCSANFSYATQTYKLLGSTSAHGRVTCQWKWAGTASIAPGSGVPESFTCNLFLPGGL